ncbi:DUF1828 domain-containing protein [Paracoccus marinus]|uniref:DUF1828 domain-containing protein n=1 Tax=Paracoccus marinus TaxID=288426 RepID=UPI00103BF03B|nr:DUF1828 domain-containing protein [Paracoccus marinus]GLS80367.1 hypothetical protein GCM10007893_11500 [Paracoccus marinus]
MTEIAAISAALRNAFCTLLDVAPVPAGYAITTGFMLPDGDLLSFYLIADADGRFHLEDDGMTLPNAVAAGLDLKSPVRDGLLRGILRDEGLCYLEDLSIRSDSVEASSLGPAALRFVSAMIRTRDLALLSRENVAASFADDVRRELAGHLPDSLALDEENQGRGGSTPDITLRNRATGIRAARVYAAGGDLRLLDALVDYQSSDRNDSPVVAVVDRRRGRVSESRFNTATNKGLPMAIVDGNDAEWVDRVLALAGAGNPRHPIMH